MRIEFDDRDLDQFPPQVQEALLRLAGQQESIDSRDVPFRGAPLTKRIVSSEDTNRDLLSRARNENGGQVIPALGNSRWRK